MFDDPEKGSIEPNQHTSYTPSFSKEPRASSSKEENEPGRESDIESTHSRDSIDTIATIEEGEGGEEPQKFKSNASSIPGPLIVVPKEKRRGLLGRFTLIPEVENPQLYERKTKWILTLFVALAAAGGPLGSAIFVRE